MEVSSIQNSAKRQCHFCGGMGNHRDIFKEYYDNKQREVYSELFYDCFSICVSNDTATKLICTHCILRLKAANSFKDLVIQAENKLIDPLQRQDSQFTAVIENQIDIKLEPGLKHEYYDFEESQNYDNDDAADESQCSDDAEHIYCDVDLKMEDTEDIQIQREQALVNRFAESDLTLPRQVPQWFQNKLNRFRGLIITSKEVTQIFEETEDSQTTYNINTGDVSEKRALISNVLIILENTNATPFRSKARTGFHCFFCRAILKDTQDIRSHMKAEHDNKNFKIAIWRCGSESLLVNVDVTDLKCTLCEAGLANLNEAKKHLQYVHKKKFHDGYTERLIPYKLTGSVYDCAVCDGRFETFGSLERHMNVHNRNYVCRLCGSGFVTKYRLKVHIRAKHIEGNFPCSICKKVFTTHQKHKAHFDAIHKMVKRSKCPLCDERFTEYTARQRHLVEAHGCDPVLYNCNVCEKSFDRRYKLSTHMKKFHLKEKNHECEYCGYSCYNITDLKYHIIKHVGERTHECSVCKKAYSRKKTLKEHMKIHNNDRKHTCAVCGQAFVQKCSLKGHIKTHHPETLE